jgi:hypothetical protein
MVGRRARTMVAAICALAILASIQVASVAAATCLLSAPETVAIGAQLSIMGSGFPASTTVDVSLSVEGGPQDQFTAQSDTTGAFEIRLTPEAVDAGITTVVATAGADCAAQVVIAVGVAPVQNTPEPTGTEAGAEAGAEAAPPRTDAAVDSGRTPATSSNVWSAAWLLLLIGIAGLVGTRRAPRD